MRVRQLTLEGSETRHPPPRLAARRRPLSAAQERILRVLRRQGVLRSVEAGVILHRLRGNCAFGTRANQWPMRGLACCPYAGRDGLAVCKRMMEKGLVVRGPTQGTWILKTREEEKE